MTSSEQDAGVGPVGVDRDERDDEIEPFFPGLSEWSSRLRETAVRGWRPFDAAACALLLTQLGIAAYIVVPGSFYLDDLRLQSMASHGLTASYLLASGSNHFAPGPRFLAWLETAIAPLDHTAAIFLQLGLQLLASGLMYRLVRTLWGPRRVAIVPLAVYALSPMLLPIDGWWTQSLSLLPVHAAIIGGLLAHVRYLQTGELRWGHAGVLAYAVGLLFWEMAVLAALAVTLLTWLYYPAGRGRASLLLTLKKHSLIWTGYVGVTVAYAAIYLTQSYGRGGTGVSPSDVLRMLGNQVGRTFLPSLVGGPWTWRTDGSYFGIASPAAAAVVGASVAAALLVVVTARYAWRAWLLLGVCFAANFLIVAYGRLALFGSNAGLDYRYVSVVAVSAALAIGLALLPAPAGSPLQGTSHHGSPLRTVQPAILYTGVALLALSTSVSAITFGRAWHKNPVGGFVGNAASDLREKHGRVNLYDTVVPGPVLPAFFYPWNSVSHVLAPIVGSATTFNDARQLFMLVDVDGHVVGTRLAGVVHGIPGPNGKCGYPVTPATQVARIPLDGNLPRLDNTTMRVEFIVASATSVRLSVGQGDQQTDVAETPRPLHLDRGLAALVVQTPPQVKVSDVVVGPFTPNTFVCVTSVSVGVPTPIRFGKSR